MKIKNIAYATKVLPSGRITRAKAAACHANERLYMKLSAVGPNRHGKRKKDENDLATPTAAPQCKKKKRTVLKDVTNTCSGSANGCINAAKLQDKVSLKLKPCISMTKSCSDHISEKNSDLVSGINQEMESESCSTPDQELFQDPFRSCITIQNEVNSQGMRLEPDGRTKSVTVDHGGLSDMDIVDIDSGHTNPLMCSSYSCEMNSFQCAAEQFSRPDPNFMETVQKDINHSMRGILIDWLVEVSDEYSLVPDTLYLAVNFIDRYLSENCIERQKLQLLGITCMLIASKYEEICAPPVDEFCSITDNTYTKAEVPPQALIHLANYLAELTLVEYSFLKFLPSIIAASSVFLARWTIEQSDHPWNKSLEHYTSYKASELKPTIIALRELQMNTNNCPLNAIHEKYKQPKFQSVATMVSPELPQSLF